jgi:hypothetical protein
LLGELRIGVGMVGLIVVLLALVASIETWPLLFAAFFAVGTWQFMVFVAVFSLVMFILISDFFSEAEGNAFTVIIALTVLVLFQRHSEAKPISTALASPWQTVGLVAGYFVVGALWSVLKWYLHESARFRMLKANFCALHDVAADQIIGSVALHSKWQAEVKSQRKYSSRDTRFFAWVAYWPWSMAWTILNDPFTRLCKRIVQEMQGVYNKISDRVWRAA